MFIGFTGTRHGMTIEQKNAVHHLVTEMLSMFDGLGFPFRAHTFGVHGGCVGADAEFAGICQGLKILTLEAPCIGPLDLKQNTGSVLIADPQPPMMRNRMIVNLADRMIATPFDYGKPKKAGGTWATIRFTERARKPLAIVLPDGSVVTGDEPGMASWPVPV